MSEVSIRVDAFEGEALATGLLNVDAVLGGLWPGELVCIAGTSRSGRHSLACQMDFSVARQGTSVLIVSCEFDDSIVTGTAAEKRIAMAEVGVTMHPWEYRMRFFGEDEQTARRNAEGLGAGKPAQPFA